MKKKKKKNEIQFDFLTFWFFRIFSSNPRFLHEVAEASGVSTALLVTLTPLQPKMLTNSSSSAESGELTNHSSTFDQPSIHFWSKLIQKEIFVKVGSSSNFVKVREISPNVAKNPPKHRRFHQISQNCVKIQKNRQRFRNQEKPMDFLLEIHHSNVLHLGNQDVRKISSNFAKVREISPNFAKICQSPGDFARFR